MSRFGWAFLKTVVFFLSLLAAFEPYTSAGTRPFQYEFHIKNGSILEFESGPRRVIIFSGPSWRESIIDDDGDGIPDFIQYENEAIEVSVRNGRNDKSEISMVITRHKAVSLETLAADFKESHLVTMSFIRKIARIEYKRDCPIKDSDLMENRFLDLATPSSQSAGIVDRSCEENKSVATVLDNILADTKNFESFESCLKQTLPSGVVKKQIMDPLLIALSPLNPASSLCKVGKIRKVTCREKGPAGVKAQFSKSDGIMTLFRTTNRSQEELRNDVLHESLHAVDLNESQIRSLCCDAGGFLNESKLKARPPGSDCGGKAFGNQPNYERHGVPMSASESAALAADAAAAAAASSLRQPKDDQQIGRIAAGLPFARITANPNDIPAMESLYKENEQASQNVFTAAANLFNFIPSAAAAEPPPDPTVPETTESAASAPILTSVAPKARETTTRGASGPTADGQTASQVAKGSNQISEGAVAPVQNRLEPINTSSPVTIVFTGLSDPKPASAIPGRLSSPDQPIAPTKVANRPTRVGFNGGGKDAKPLSPGESWSLSGSGLGGGGPSRNPAGVLDASDPYVKYVLSRLNGPDRNVLLDSKDFNKELISARILVVGPKSIKIGEPVSPVLRIAYDKKQKLFVIKSGGK